MFAENLYKSTSDKCCLNRASLDINETSAGETVHFKIQMHTLHLYSHNTFIIILHDKHLIKKDKCKSDIQPNNKKINDIDRQNFPAVCCHINSLLMI